MVRARHAWEGCSLELMRWMRRRGRLELIVVLPDGSHLMIPAGWTDLEGPVGRWRRGRWGRLMICWRRAGCWSRCLSVPPGPSAMIVVRRPIVQLRLGLAESPALAVALWELVGEPQRQSAMTLLTALIAQPSHPGW